jgi:hypothetical protein
VSIRFGRQLLLLSGARQSVAVVLAERSECRAVAAGRRATGVVRGEPTGNEVGGG